MFVRWANIFIFSSKTVSQSGLFFTCEKSRQPRSSRRRGTSTLVLSIFFSCGQSCKGGLRKGVRKVAFGTLKCLCNNRSAVSGNEPSVNWLWKVSLKILLFQRKINQTSARICYSARNRATNKNTVSQQVWQFDSLNISGNHLPFPSDFPLSCFDPHHFPSW